MRYARQPHARSCGPTAILNALKWAGRPATLKREYPILRAECKCTNGTWRYIFDRVIRKHAKGLFTVERRALPTYSQLRRLCRSGHAFVLAYMNVGWQDAHYAFYFPSAGKLYAVNEHDKCATVALCSKRQLMGALRRLHVPGRCIDAHNPIGCYPVAWLLRKS